MFDTIAKIVLKSLISEGAYKLFFGKPFFFEEEKTEGKEENKLINAEPEKKSIENMTSEELSPVLQKRRSNKEKEYCKLLFHKEEQANLEEEIRRDVSKFSKYESYVYNKRLDECKNQIQFHDESYHTKLFLELFLNYEICWKETRECLALIFPKDRDIDTLLNELTKQKSPLEKVLCKICSWLSQNPRLISKRREKYIIDMNNLNSDKKSSITSFTSE